MKRLGLLLISLAIILLPVASFADTSATAMIPSYDSGSANTVLTPPLTDYSVNYLSQIFGTVPGVLHGTSGDLLGKVFKTFNYVVIILVSFVVAYAIFLSIIYTATDGSFMGRDKKGAFIVLRIAAGVGLVAPVFQGYSAIQVLVLAAVFHGVGAADLVWNKALSYLKTGGVVYQAPATDLPQLTTMASNVFRAEVCMYQSQEWLNDSTQNAQAQLKNDPSNPILLQQAQTSYANLSPVWNNVTQQVTFPGGSVGMVSNDACGTIGWGIATGDNAAKKDEYVKVALQQMISDVDPVAQNIIVSRDTSMSFVSPKLQYDESISAMIAAAADYINITIPARNTYPQDEQKQINALYRKGRKEGWVTAGSFYYALIELENSQMIPASQFQFSPDNVPDFTGDSYPSFNATDLADMRSLMNTKVIVYSNDAVTEANAVVNSQKAGDNMNLKWSYFSTHTADLGVGGHHPNLPENIINIFFRTLFTEPVNDWTTMVTNSAQEDPIIAMQQFGISLMEYIPNSISQLATNFDKDFYGPDIHWSANLLNGKSVRSVGLLLYAALIILFLAPLWVMLIGIFFTQGLILGFYIPLIPAFLFLFVAMGWFLSVIESVVAAPFVALGVTHPEGHDLMGQAQQAIGLALNVCLKPMLVVLGLLGGIVLSDVAIKLLNAGFGIIVGSVGSSVNNMVSNSRIGEFLFSITMMVVYTVLAMAAVNKSYSLITQIPEKVLSWIGYNSHDRDDSMEIVKQGQQAAGQVGQQTVQAAGSTASSAAGAAKSLAG